MSESVQSGLRAQTKQQELGLHGLLSVNPTRTWMWKIIYPGTTLPVQEKTNRHFKSTKAVTQKANLTSLGKYQSPQRQ